MLIPQLASKHQQRVHTSDDLVTKKAQANMHPPSYARSKKNAEPSIERFTIRSAEEADEPRSRLELDVLHALGVVYNKREWWTKWTSCANTRAQWVEEMEDALVKSKVAQALAASPRVARLRVALAQVAAMPNGPAKKIKMEEMLQNVDAIVDEEDENDHESDDDDMDLWQEDEGEQSESDASEEGEDDSDDDLALDEDDNIVSFDDAVAQAKKTRGNEEWEDDVSMEDDSDMEDDEDDSDSLRAHQQKEPFEQITLYVTMAMLRRSVDAISETDQSLVDQPEIITRSCSLIRDVLRSASQGEAGGSLDVVKAHLPEETRADVLEKLQFHFQEVYSLLETTKHDIHTVLAIVVDRLGLPAKPEEMASSVGAILSPGPAPLVWMSDSLVPVELTTSFVSEVAVLERATQGVGQVVNLVDPSLYCGVIGQTKRLPESAAKKMYGSAVEHMNAIMALPVKSNLATRAIKKTTKKTTKNVTKFQWLPCEIEVDETEDGGQAMILTYINNLHPETFAGLYTSISSIYARFVPLFDTVLSSLDDQAGDRAAKALYDHGSAGLPCAPCLVPPGLFEMVEPQLSLKGTRCQVVVKLSEIHLTSQQPKYAGSFWHVDGTDSERIIATGMYFFGCENVTEPRMALRVFVKDDANDERDVTCDDEQQQPSVQNMGSVTAMGGRCVVFPNIYQQKMEPFRLEDPAKPGVLKVLVFYLVDPTQKPIPSTAVVPPQQREWIEQARVQELGHLRLADTARPRIEHASEGITLDEAMGNRIKLIHERAPAPDQVDVDWVMSLGEF